MKIRIIALLLAGLGLATAAEDKMKAPNGGRLLEKVKPTAEFLVNPDKKIEIRFLEDGKVIAPAAQVVTVTMGDRSNPTKLTFAKEGDKMISDKAIPDGANHPVVVQIKTTPDDKAVIEKFTLNLEKCPTCSNSEYACSCEHHD